MKKYYNLLTIAVLAIAVIMVVSAKHTGDSCSCSNQVCNESATDADSKNVCEDAGCNSSCPETKESTDQLIEVNHDDTASETADLKSNTDSKEETQEPASQEPKEAASLPKLIELGADKCIPCKMMAPILAELEESYSGKMEVIFYDVWKLPEFAQQYGVTSIPTQIFIDSQGKELFRHTGFYSKEEILSKWSELGVAFN